ncbi:RDM4 [Acrasis kona]|uniref:RDM4 n=1 Tax=Acrasis kona TaxID=1008807 RepID=A0AAW2YKD2_9EUKA
MSSAYEFKQRVEAKFSAIDKLSSAPPFQLNTSQHSNKNDTDNMYNTETKFDIFDVTKESTKYDITEEEQPLENVPKPSTSSKVLICVKRKRDEEPINDFYLEVDSEMPSAKRIKNVDDITKKLETTNLEDTKKPSEDVKKIRMFSLVETVNDRRRDTEKNVLSRVREKRTQLKETPVSTRSQNIEKMQNANRKVRFAKIMEKRRLDHETNIVQVDLQEEMDDFQDPSIKDYVSLLKEHYRPVESEYEYDYYYMDDNQPESSNDTQRMVVKIDAFDEENIYVDTEYDPKQDSDYDSEDSNASYLDKNDYPDEEPSSNEDDDEERDSEDGYDDFYTSHRPKRYMSDSEEQDSDQDSDGSDDVSRYNY